MGIKSFENIVGNGENASHQHFLLFCIIFSTLSKTKNHHFHCSHFVFLRMLSMLTESKISPYGKEVADEKCLCCLQRLLAIHFIETLFQCAMWTLLLWMMFVEVLGTSILSLRVTILVSKLASRRI